MKVIFRAILLFVLFLIALSVLKYFVVKLVLLALWICGIALLVYLLSRLFGKA